MDWSEEELLSTKIFCALILRLNAEDFRNLKAYILKQYGAGSIIYQKLSFDRLFITERPPKKMEGVKDERRRD